MHEGPRLRAKTVCNTEATNHGVKHRLKQACGFWVLPASDVARSGYLHFVPWLAAVNPLRCHRPACNFRGPQCVFS